MAAGKLYPLNTVGPRALPATWQSNVDVVQGANNVVALDAIKDGNADTAPSVSEAVATNPYRLGWNRAVTRKLAAQTISGTFDVCLGVHESNADAEMFWKFYIYVTEGETDNVRGVLLDYEEDSGTGTEFPTTSTGKALGSAQTLTSVDAEDGDYLVIEFAFVSRNSHTTARSSTLHRGAMSAFQGDTQRSDLTVGSTSTSTLAGWVEFSNAIVLLAEQANDDCANAIGMALPYSLTLDPTRATREFSGGTATEPAVGCSGKKYNSLWWKWTPALSGNYRIVGTAGVSDSYFFTVSVWTGTCGSFSAVTCDGGWTSPADITFAATGGTEYYVLFTATSWGGGGGGVMTEFTLDVTALGSPPAHATCATAESIAALPFTDTVDTSDDVSNDAADPDDTGGQLYNTVWYTWVAPSTMYVRARTEGSDHDCRVSVYTGACGAGTPVVHSINNSHYAKWLAASGTTYRLIAGADAAIGGGSLTLVVEAMPDPLALVPGRELAFGFHRRGTHVYMPNAAGTLMAAYTSNGSSPTDAIARVHVYGSTSTGPPGIWDEVNWTVEVETGLNLADTHISVAEPYVDDWEGRLLTDSLQANISRAETLTWHSYAVAVRLSTYDPNLNTYAVDGYVALCIDGVVVGDADSVYIPQHLEDGTVRLGVRAQIDADAVWLAGGTDFPASYDAVGRPDLATLVQFWGFDDGNIDGWVPWPISNWTPGVHVTPGAGMAGGYGISSWQIAAGATGDSTPNYTHGGIIHPYGVPLDVYTNIEGEPGPIAWVEWPRRVVT